MHPPSSLGGRWRNLGERLGGLVPRADDVVRECEICRAFRAAPAIPVAGTSSVSPFTEKVQVDLLLFGDLVELHVLDLFPRHPLSSTCLVDESGRGIDYLLYLADCGFWGTPDNSDGRRRGTEE